MLLKDLNQEAIARIYSYLKDPGEFAVVCKQIHRYTQFPRSRIIWAINNINDSNWSVTFGGASVPISLEVFVPLAKEVIARVENSETVRKMIKSLLNNVDLCQQRKLYVSCIFQASKRVDADLAVKLFQDSDLSFQQLQPHWNNLNGKSFRLLLEASIESKRIDFDSDDEIDLLLESIIEKDYAACLKLLIDAGLTVPSSTLRTVTILNKPKCAVVLLKNGINPHMDNDACFYDAAVMGHINILYLLSNFWGQDLATQVLYTAVENDLVHTVEFLLKLPKVKSDRQSLVLAMDPSRGKNRNRQGQTCLQVLIDSYQDITEMNNTSRQAVLSVCNFVTQN